MSRRVSHDELALRRCEVAIGNVDGDTLLAFGSETISEIGEVDLPAARDVGRTFKGFNLIFHQGLRVVEESANERGLAVVYGAAGVEAKKIDGVLCVGHV